MKLRAWFELTRILGAFVLVVAITHYFALRAAASAPDQIRGRWVNVTPGNVDLVNKLGCDSFGTTTIQVDPARLSNLYAQFHCQGVWKSEDYGLTWVGPINVGRGGHGASGAGGLVVARGPDGAPPIMYSATIRGRDSGFWASTDGGVSWGLHRPGGFTPPVVNPYDSQHVLMTGHHADLVAQTLDGGKSWSRVPLHDGMKSGGTAFIFFVNTGNPDTTRRTWLWSADALSHGNIGTWRTEDAGQTWARVDSTGAGHGSMQLYQPGTSGLMFMPGRGVFRSTDYGRNWAQVGGNENQAIVFGTPSRVYGMYAWACRDCKLDPILRSAPTPGLNGWARIETPEEMTIGAAQAVTVFDGKHQVIVTANWHAGLWRYIEP